MIRIQNQVLGEISTNCYFLQNMETNELLIIDPADQPERILSQVVRMGGKPTAILLTHGHFDHMYAADAIRNQYQIPVYAHEAERDLLADGRKNLSSLWSVTRVLEADRLVKADEILNLAGLTIQVIHTPGHTAGGACYYVKDENVLFSGDTLFCEGFGRYDFPTSSFRSLRASVAKLLRILPEDTIVYPGHGEATSIAHEKRYNPLA